jgi:hypothetical protein
MLKRLILIAMLLAMVSILLMVSSFAAAQGDGGQFCVRAFEDRNSNGTRDSGEPLLTRGIVAELANGQGVVIASQALEDSQNAAGGVICFADLAAGTYMMSILSAEYRATTPNTTVENITPGTVPVILDYGGVSMTAQTGTTQSTDTLGLNSTDGRTLVQRLVMSSLGSLAMVALMVVIGVIVWLTIMRPRALRRAAKRATSTGQYRAVTRDDMLSMYAPPSSEDEFDAPR